MKVSVTENQKNVDAQAEGPVMSFAHLCLSPDSEAGWDERQDEAFGFPASGESDLYETGYLLRVFLKC